MSVKKLKLMVEFKKDQKVRSICAMCKNLIAEVMVFFSDIEILILVAIVFYVENLNLTKIL